ncbi:ABC transporter substrate-binding protein [Ramlibacter tataouinensis]|uniref:Candidate ABC type nitrate/sulfonate/bicarbonate transport system, periplasmic component n=1 Tax=Ramlibacter tataouinensis (strain ATCC BAA-407 / DSM 14655 / LMG 21543 / TTB310) TaxID=365046 RepID=F5Y4I0_RAMTT|nr:ABC transporter substrate-binding protein [Ramlibacter tataouinensis]AEG93827.1 candidate ABC type nitrate/sulfonate/bicarbonate transport system, periplasmic component [Ramlibacter tataouinensis TTB310]
MNSTRRFLALTLASLAAMAGLAGPAAAQALKEVRVSSQPALLGSVPFAIAEEKGWWKEAGLKVTVINFPAGAPQIAASKSWDVGYTGSVPAVLGAVRFGLHTVAFSDDQSATNALYVRGPNANTIIKSPASLKGGTVFLTGNSTVDLAARSCMAKFGLAKGDVTVRSMGQAEIIAAMSSGSVDVGGLWAPNTYTAEEKTGARMLCSGREAGVMVPGNLVVRAEWAKENPQLVARFLAVYLRAQRWMAANRKDALAVMKKHYDAGGVVISEAAMNKELELRPTFDLASQLAMFNRGAQPSRADATMNTIASFMKEVGALRADEALPDPRTYVTDEYLRLIDRDPQLKAFASRSD